MTLLAIDPGTKQSAFVVLDDFQRVVEAGIMQNPELLDLIQAHKNLYGADHLAIEMIASYGMPVGREVFETVLWSGRFIDRWVTRTGAKHTLIYRKDEKITLCGSMKAKDANIRQALIDRYGPGKEAAIGKKASPGPLYGFKADMWAALSVGCTYLDMYGNKEE